MLGIDIHNCLNDMEDREEAEDAKQVKQAELITILKKALFETNAINAALYNKVDELKLEFENVKLEIDELQEELGYVQNYYDDDLGDGMTFQKEDAELDSDDLDSIKVHIKVHEPDGNYKMWDVRDMDKFNLGGTD